MYFSSNRMIASICQQQACCIWQVHTYDHTLTPQSLAAVSSIPGVNFHSAGIARY